MAAIIVWLTTFRGRRTHESVDKRFSAFRSIEEGHKGKFALFDNTKAPNEDNPLYLDTLGECKRKAQEVLDDEEAKRPPKGYTDKEGSHRHQCPECGNVWEHGDIPQYPQRSHRCPECNFEGAECFVKYHGPLAPSNKDKSDEERKEETPRGEAATAIIISTGKADEEPHPHKEAEKEVPTHEHGGEA